ncbi:hypothetical protein BD310DRAFT_97726 [Dichomitus squalens]|uniref:Uncharacterized protein n=1 Tax=Dichomitus squalens TaxID=114155 RepID=A0A4Q9PJH1_9APHY|nr:hypothetical protein BD310DRAFT_97726 [Dichomitus squalens]
MQSEHTTAPSVSERWPRRHWRNVAGARAVRIGHRTPLALSASHTFRTHGEGLVVQEAAALTRAGASCDGPCSARGRARKERVGRHDVAIKLLIVFWCVFCLLQARAMYDRATGPSQGTRGAAFVLGVGERWISDYCAWVQRAGGLARACM